ncbi:gliding motility-associated C-terminal domain-containing protein [Tenacibaculum sp. MAR_2009_124]|uniref:T9SS type B sorting domain-containing protein n=1 Tax=Tenacibaculum sp. MAR_2009_124 TaxID=1250059 RepID=UPI00089ACBB4|nr:T9SS type B sorting domain-containing protein [Tenacibaculum sp. MAR_2009_124]SEC86191.1 gliding motility-associated C-terminal domain-containing protein [Tenacibaculum sp. MAR_2009_124]
MKNIIGFLVLLFTSHVLLGQNDCATPLVVCGNEGFNNIEVSGPGTQELIGTNSCASQEHNSLWFDVTIKTDGTLAFTLKPESNDINEDFDFFVFGPNASCTNLGQAIRCSTTNPAAASLSSNHTGMSVSANDTTEGPGPDGNSFVSAIDAIAGERYFIVIDRPIGSSNFTIDWTGTAEFNDAPEAEIPVGTTIDLEECDSTSPHDDQLTEFDLTQNDFIIGSQTGVTISYYVNNTFANTGENPIANPSSFINTSNNQTVYARLENTITGCYNVSAFNLTVVNGASVQEANIEECDENNDGFTSFNLASLNALVLVSGDPNDYSFSYHLSANDAQNNTSNLSNVYTNVVQDQQEIYVRVVNLSNNFCVSTIKANLIVLSSPEVVTPVELKQCDDDTDAVTFFNLEEVKSKISVNHTSETITFYESLSNAQNEVNEISDITTYENNTPSSSVIWSRIESSNGCYKTAEINLVVSTTNIPDNFMREFEACDYVQSSNDSPQDGIATFDFSSVDVEIKNMFTALGQQISVSYYESQLDALAENNAIPNISSYRNENSPFQQNIYVRVDSDLDNDCLGLGHHVTLTVNSLPEFSIDAPEYICRNSTATLEASLTSIQNVQYRWNYKNESSVLGVNEQLVISNEGEYELTVTNIDTGCMDVREVEVKLSSSPVIDREDIVIFDDLNGASDEYKIQILKENLGVGDYEFSLENENGVQTSFQVLAEFKNLNAGKYTLIVRDANGCQPNAELDFSILRFPRFFTPNSDGENDTWVIKGLDQNLFKQGDIIVFDRFGKIIFKDSVFGLGWDGSFQGVELPSNDYWFSLNLTDVSENSYNFEGHFSLLRK